MSFRLSLLSILLVAFAAVAPLRAEKTEFLFELRSGVVEYQTTTTGKGVNTTGIETFSFVARGQKSARYTKTTNSTRFLGRTKTEETENMAILRDGWVYTIDLKTRAGTKMSMEQIEKMAQSMGKGAQGQTARAYAKDFVEKNGGQWLAPEEFLGRKCEVFTLWGFKTWAYKGVPLKTEGSMMGVTTTMVATRFEENASVPDSTFELPKDVQFQDMSEMMGMLGGMFGGGQNGSAATAKTGTAPEAEEAAPAKPAPKPAPVAEKKKAEPKPAKKVAKKSDPDAVGLSLGEFREAITKVHVKGYTRMAAESTGGTLKVNLLDTKGGALSLTALPLSVFDALENHPQLKIESKFDHEGHAAFAGVLDDPDSGPTSVVIVRYPERKLTLVVGSVPVTDKGTLLALLEQVAF